MHTTDSLDRFMADVRAGLKASPKHLSPEYFYDALGSHLFEAICQLPWYPLTRAEGALLERHAEEMVAPFGAGASIVELGCGSGEKLALLAAPLCKRVPRLSVHLVDVSETALDLSRRTLGRLPRVETSAHRARYEEGLSRATARRAIDARGGEGAVLVLFLGSNIGNLAPATAAAFLAALRASLRAGDGLLLGADLVKPAADLVLAYDDPLGVTSAFNKNLLARMNRELGATFDLRSFDHRATWNAQGSRVEMHLVSRRRQSIRVGALDLEVAFEEGESIWTESSYKYEPDDVVRMGERAGFRCSKQWIEPIGRFSTTLLLAEERAGSR
ncbi:L-histidine N(alpha)-methyltransferase [Sorangium sp. So ce1014]|uniref:L-histidine N(alpha)-methyltransferase n=1 Tax=Sorangium sp. So ce1014 TaxID=3133326 RepID=UPI003F5F179E